MTRRPRGMEIVDSLKVLDTLEVPGTFEGDLSLNGTFTQERVAIETLASVTSIATYSEKSGFFMLEEFVFESQDLTVVDSGGGDGGILATKLCDFPDTQIVVLGGTISVAVTAVESGISATGDVHFGIGTTASINGALTGAELNLAAAASMTLVGGAGVASGSGPAIATLIDGIAATKSAYLNIGVLDGDITADAAVTFSGIARFYWLDLSRGL